MRSIARRRGRLRRRAAEALDRRPRARNAVARLVQVGASVRGSLALERTSRAWALVHGALVRRPGGRRGALRAGDRSPAAPRRLRARRREPDAGRGRATRLRGMSRARSPATAGLGAGGARRRGMTQATPRPFELVPRRLFVGTPFGRRRSARRGQGDEVAGTRPYRPGDQRAHIDWPASARLSAARGTDEFVVREFYADEAPCRDDRLRSTRGHGGPPCPVTVARQTRRSRGCRPADHGERSRRARRRRVRRRSTAASVVAPRSHGRLAAADAARG